MPQEPKYRAIQEFGRDKGWSIQKMCRFLGVCRAAYYKWLHRTPSDKQLSDEDLAEKIKVLYWEQNGILGYRQMTIAIIERNVIVTFIDHILIYADKRVEIVFRWQDECDWLETVLANENSSSAIKY